MKKIRLALFALTAALIATGAAAQFDDGSFHEQSGEDIYKNICQGCHMPDAKGAVGAGMYPALAKNPRLEISAYPISIILHGQKAMPWFGDYFSDQQVANVVNYIRSNFGNRYRDKVKPGDVKALR